MFSTTVFAPAFKSDRRIPISALVSSRRASPKDPQEPGLIALAKGRRSHDGMFLFCSTMPQMPGGVKALNRGPAGLEALR
jgi:hypothetical protein